MTVITSSVSTTVEFSPVVVNPQGATSSDRKIDVVNTTRSTSVLLAHANDKGKVGAAVRARLATTGEVDIVRHAISGNYQPLAEHMAILSGEPVVIGSRASFESLPDRFEQDILKIRATKTGGMKTDAKTGVEVPGPKLAMAMGLKALVTEVIAECQAHYARRAAERAAKQAAEALL